MMTIPDFCEKFELPQTSVYRLRAKYPSLFRQIAGKWFVKNAETLASVARTAKRGNPNFRKKR